MTLAKTLVCASTMAGQPASRMPPAAALPSAPSSKWSQTAALFYAPLWPLPSHHPASATMGKEGACGHLVASLLLGPMPTPTGAWGRAAKGKWGPLQNCSLLLRHLLASCSRFCSRFCSRPTCPHCCAPHLGQVLHHPKLHPTLSPTLHPTLHLTLHLLWTVEHCVWALRPSLHLLGCCHIGPTRSGALSS